MMRNRAVLFTRKASPLDLMSPESTALLLPYVPWNAMGTYGINQMQLTNQSRSEFIVIIIF